jgi:hypothetical protein
VEEKERAERRREGRRVGEKERAQRRREGRRGGEWGVERRISVPQFFHRAVS